MCGTSSAGGPASEARSSGPTGTAERAASGLAGVRDRAASPASRRAGVRDRAVRAAAAIGGPWVALATLVAALLWTRRLGANPLFVDEAASWSVAAQDGLSAWWRVLLHQEVAPPPFYLGLRGIVDAAGATGHPAMRLPVVLLTLPSVPLAALVARRCGGTVVATAGAAWLVALSPLMLMYAQQVRAYGPAATATLLAVLLLLRAADEASARPWAHGRALTAGLALGVAPWVHYVAWIPLVPALLVALVVAPWPARRRLVVAAVPLWAGAAVVALVQYGHVGAGMDGFTSLGGEDLRRVLAGAWDGRFAGGTALLVLGCAGLAAALASAVVLRGRARLVALGGLLGPATIVVVSVLGPDIVTTRYLVPCAPLLLVGVALGAERLPARSAVGGVAVLAVLGLAGVVRSLTPSDGDYPDFERTAGYVVPSLRPGSVVASESFFLGTWIPEYVAARAGVADVRSAWGQGQLIPEVCARRRILDLSAPEAADAARGFLEAAGYAVTVEPTPSPDDVLVTGEPRGGTPAACAGLAASARP